MPRRGRVVSDQQCNAPVNGPTVQASLRSDLADGQRALPDRVSYEFDVFRRAIPISN